MAKRKFVTVVDYSTVSKQQKLQHMPRQHDFFDGKNSNFSLMFIRQSLVPLILASIGLVFAGWTLDYAEKTEVFANIKEIYIMIPALLGMKGNLEMTMISRITSISSRASFRVRKLQIAKSNLALTQCQAIITGLCAALFASGIHFMRTMEFDLSRIVLLSSISVLTSSLATFLLGFLNFLIIDLAVSFKINPDNIATPLAAATGDVVTLFLLIIFGDCLFGSKGSISLYLFLTFSIAIVPLYFRVARKSIYTEQASKQCWIPIILSMLISSFGGLILNSYLLNMDNVLQYQPLINGIGGNIAAIQASRLSTMMYINGNNPDLFQFTHLNPFSFLFKKDSHSTTSRILLFMSLPLHCFSFFLVNFEICWMNPFLKNYLLASMMQIALLLYLVELISVFMLKLQIDPDNSAIPYLTAIGDFSGALFLYLAFINK